MPKPTTAPTEQNVDSTTSVEMVTITLELPGDLVEKIDAAAKADDRKRSPMVRRILAFWAEGKLA